jgi:amidase
MLNGDVKGLRFALVPEGFGGPGAEKDVDEAVTAAARSFEKRGAKVATVSIPWHRDGMAIWTGIGAEGALATMITGSGLGTNWKGYYATGLLDAFARGLRTHPDDLSESAKLFTMLGAYMRERYHGHFYAKAQNLARSLKGAYDAALRENDLLVMPTMATKAPKLPAPGCSREEYLTAALGMLANTAQFNITGHPAMNVPCAKSQGLPIGMMLVGKTGDDATLLRAADAWQKAFADQ